MAGAWRAAAAAFAGAACSAGSHHTTSWHPGCRWKPPRTVLDTAAVFMSDQEKMRVWGILEQLERSSHPSPRFLGHKVPVTPEMGTGVGEDHFNEPNGINYSRFWSLHIALVRIYSLGLARAQCCSLLAVSTARSGVIPHICSERQFGGLNYMDCTMSIEGKFRKTDPRCPRAIYSLQQKHLKPHKTIKPHPNPTRNHQKGSFTF